MAGQGIAKQINKTIFKPSTKQTDKKILTITVDRKKEKLFDFLNAKTQWNAYGEWRGATKLYRDKNVVLEVEFMDDKQEKTSRRLLNLLKNFNDQVVKEELLYTRITDIERSSL